MRFIILIIIYVLPSIAMADLFTPPPTDKSVDLLGHILGTNIGSVYLGGTSNPALMHMFELFNSIIMTLATMIVSYIGIISTMNTAQEGHVMGKKWSSIWIPMRSILGMLVIVPTPASGYSVIQAMVMWCIMNGIGAADTIWNGVLKDLSNGLSATSAITRDSKDDPHSSHVYDALELIGADMAESMLRSAVCMRTIVGIHNRTAVEPQGGFKTPEDSHIKTDGGKVRLYESINNTQISDSEHASYSGVLRVGIPGDPEFNSVCGQYAITGVAHKSEWEAPLYVNEKEIAKKAKEIYHYKTWAMQMIFNNLTQLANSIVDESVTPRDYNNRLAVSAEDRLQPGGYRSEAINTYREILKYMVKPQRINEVQDIVHEGMADGWLSAGSFYFTLNQHHNVDFFGDILVPPTATAIPSCDHRDSCSEYNPEKNNMLSTPLRNFLQYGPETSYMATRLWDAKIYLDNDLAMISNKLLLKSKQNTAENPLSSLQSNMLSLLNEMMGEQHADPLIAQGRFGASIMLLSERSWLDLQNELQTTINRAEQGYMPLTDQLMQHINNLSHRGSLSMAIYSIVWVIGATLAIYVPLVPYMIFTVGVLGWLLLVIEAIVAAPILAISFILPAGDELGKVMQGLLLLLNILIRPILMIFGFVLATRLYQAIVKLVNYGMLANFNHLNTTDSLFAWVAVLTLYGAFIIALSNKCFSLIYALPDKILRWMGGAPEHTDASHELHEAKSTMLKGADTANKVSMGIPERNFARLQTRAKQLSPPDSVSGG